MLVIPFALCYSEQIPDEVGQPSSGRTRTNRPPKGNNLDVSATTAASDKSSLVDTDAAIPSKRSKIVHETSSTKIATDSEGNVTTKTKSGAGPLRKRGRPKKLT